MENVAEHSKEMARQAWAKIQIEFSTLTFTFGRFHLHFKQNRYIFKVLFFRLTNTNNEMTAKRQSHLTWMNFCKSISSVVFYRRISHSLCFTYFTCKLFSSQYSNTQRSVHIFHAMCASHERCKTLLKSSTQWNINDASVLGTKRRG